MVFFYFIQAETMKNVVEQQKLVMKDLDIDKLVKIKPAKIEVYPEEDFDDENKPEVGKQLNKQAILSFKNMAPKGQSYENYIAKLKNSI